MENTRVDELKETFDRLVKDPHEFTELTIVCWKAGLRNRRYPKYNQPVIVVEVLSDPIEDAEQNSGSAYFKERLDIVLGIIDEEGDFVTFHFDKRRFEPWKTDE